MFEGWSANYKRSPGYFWGWLIVLVGLGLMAFWIPILKDVTSEIPVAYGRYVIAGELSTFSIVIIIEGYLAAMTRPKGVRINHALIGIGVLILLANMALYIFTMFDIQTHTIKWAILGVFILSLLMAIHLYKYKSIELDEPASILVEEQDESINRATNQGPVRNPLPPTS